MSAAPLSAIDHAGADFRHVRHWIFDLDNTLYRADNGIFAGIEGRMTDYVMRVTGLPRGEARLLQKSLYRAHGTTMNGLMALHGVDPDDYLAYVHDVDLTMLTPDPALVAALARLPGRRTIFTNGCRHHAARILARIGMAGLFEEIWDIRAGAFTPKPQPAAYERMVSACAIAPHQAAMFDDLAANLAAARGLGMTTVWLDTGGENSRQDTVPPPAAQNHITHRAADLCRFLHTIRT